MAEQLPIITKSHAVNTTASPAGSLLGRGLLDIQNKNKQVKEVKIEHFDSELAGLIELSGFYIEGGIKKFVDVVNAISRDTEIPIEKMKPYLVGWYEGARESLKVHGVDVSDMDNRETVDKEFTKLFTEPEEKVTENPVHQNSGK